MLLQVTLEKVLGITASGNCGLACDPRSGLVAYPAGWEERHYSCVPISTYDLWLQHALHSRRLLYHIWLKQMLVCVCYLCTISEEARRGALASSSIYPFPKETSFESLCSILMFRVLISTIGFLNEHLVFGPLYICERLYLYVIFSKRCNAQFVYSMANHLLSQGKSAQAVAPGTQFPGTEIKNRQHTNGWFLCSRRKTVFFSRILMHKYHILFTGAI